MQLLRSKGASGVQGLQEESQPEEENAKAEPVSSSVEIRLTSPGVNVIALQAEKGDDTLAILRQEDVWGSVTQVQLRT